LQSQPFDVEVFDTEYYVSYAHGQFDIEISTDGRYAIVHLGNRPAAPHDRRSASLDERGQP